MQPPYIAGVGLAETGAGDGVSGFKTILKTRVHGHLPKHSALTYLSNNALVFPLACSAYSVCVF